MKRFVATAVRDALLGLALGALTALVLRLGEDLLPTQIDPSKNRALDVFGAPQIRLIAVVVIASLLVFWAGQIAGFLVRLARSWTVGLITGICQAWFLLSLFFFLRQGQWGGKAHLLFGSVGLLAIASSLLMFRQRSSSTVDHSIVIPAPVSISDETLFSRRVEFDLPIDKWDEDRLNRGRLVQSVATLILQDKAPVIAIVGPFGEGKTSALNLLGRSLDSRKDLTIVVRFSSWLPGGEGTLAYSLFGTISERVESRYLVPGLSGELRRFARLLAGAVPKVGGSLGSFFEEPSQVDLIHKLTRVLRILPIRVVVLIDEVDRMDSKELHLLLKAIRGVADLPNVTYVCAFDRKAVLRLISQGDTPYGRSYLEKFFPMQVPLPRIDQELLGTFFDQKLEGVIKTFNLLPNERDRKKFGEAVQEVWHTVIKRYLSNFRRMTLFFNALHSSLGPVSAEINLYDMMILQLVKMMSEDTHEFIYDNGPLFYEPSWRIASWMERLSVDEKAESAIRDKRLKEFFDSLDQGTRAWVTELLATIFPTVNHCLRGDRFSWRSQSAESAEEQHRIYHPDYFPRYFIYQVPSGMFGVAEMATFIESMNALQDVEQCVTLFRKQLGDLAANPWRRWDFLRSMVTEADHLGAVQREGVINGVVEISDSLEYDFFGVSDWGRARALVFVAAKAFTGTPKIESVLGDAIRRATSDAFAVDLLAFCTGNRPQNKIITDWRDVSEDALKSAFDERMRGQYTVGSQQQVQYNPKELRPFHVWASLSDESRRRVADFFRDRFDRYALEQGRFLGWALPHGEIYDGDPLTAVGRLFPVDELFESARTQPSGFWAVSDKESVERFLDLVRKRRGEQQVGEQG